MNTRMVARRKNPQTGLYYPNLVPLSAIRRFARRIAERFAPDKIILFGSYAYGTPTPDSDVDLLVVMPAKNELDQAVLIRETLGEEGYRHGFPLDLLVRSQRKLEQGIGWGDWFLREIVTRGKVLYEKADSRLASQGRQRSGDRPRPPADSADSRGSNLLLLPASRRKVPQKSHARMRSSPAQDT